MKLCYYYVSSCEHVPDQNTVDYLSGIKFDSKFAVLGKTFPSIIMMMMMINTPMIKENATRNCQKFTCGDLEQFLTP